jgi:plasmid stabilization system protein ParE
MLLQIIFLPSAKSDIQSAVNWYEKQQPGLGKRFKKQIIGAIDSILDTRRDMVLFI